MAFVTLALTAILVVLVQVGFQRQPRTKQRIADALLVNLFLFPVGLGGLFAFVGHTMRATPVAASIGWPAGNPFQYEVAVANLAFGVLGLLCVWDRGFWNATAIGWSIFMLGAAAVHIHQIRSGQTFAPGNAGAVLYFDIIVPLFLLGLLVIRRTRALI
jgi:hypothetical protein